MRSPVAKDIDEYIAAFPGEVKERLKKLRSIIQKAAPKATETISYAIPTFIHHGQLVHFAGYKNHVGFYPGASGVEAFRKDITAYNSSKGAIQFPHDKPLPIKLITSIVKFRAIQNEEKVKSKSRKQEAGAKTDIASVNNWLKQQSPAARSEINAVRKIIKSASAELNERIKWNAPSYYYKHDVLTFGPYKKGKLLLVFHHPSVVSINSHLLQGNYKDRRLVYFKDKTDAQKHSKELTRIIKEIIAAINIK